MIIQAIQVTKTYSNHTALKNLSLDIPKGQIYGLLGPNGAGKTSFIRILTQITQADSGTILFNGQNLTSKHIYEIGYLPEERGLYKKMQVAEQLLYFAELKGLSPKDAKVKLKYWVDKFEIQSWLGKKVEELSKGMQQKIQFIATVLHEPKLIILDEPFSGFDPINAQLLVDEILLLKVSGCTIIFSTHRMDSVELLCDKIALINRSEKVLEGNVEDIKNQFKSNTYEVIYDGENLIENDTFSIEHIDSKKKKSALISLKQNLNNNQIIQSIMNQNVEILSFSEKLPSMEEIFIKAVESSNLNK
jgi:ABC-2 type transport system ATP-binding protein